MSPSANPNSADDQGHRGRCGAVCNAPLPAKLLGAGALFLVCHPLGLLAAGATLWHHYRGRPFPGPGPHHGFRHGRWRRYYGSGNSAFDEAQRETLNKLEEDAKAFDEFQRKQREARDREAFERFTSERNAPRTSEPPKE